MAGRICPSCRKNLDAPPEPAPTPAGEIDYGMASAPMQVGGDPSGFADPRAQRVVDSRETQEAYRQYQQATTEANRQIGQKNMMFGALWCFGGLALTAISFRAAANSGGGRYVLAWGAILFGGIQFIRGMIQSASRE
jgi:hypothetical protein